MKKTLLIILVFLLSIQMHAQWTDNGNNLTTSDKVGIGANPAYNLDVQVPLTTDATIFRAGVTGYSNGFAITYTNSPQKLNYVFGSGNVGIGTVNPEKELEVVGTILSNRVETNITNTGSLGTHSFQELGETKAFIQWRGSTSSTYPSKFRIGTQSNDDIWFVTNGVSRMAINSDGNIGIGTDLSSNPNSYKLAVNGTIGAKEIKVEINSSTWSDFVFNDDYKLRSIKEVENYINEKNHLPDIPTAKEVEDNGINLGEMEAKLLQKIEELTLYIIEQNKKIEDLQSQINEINN